MHDTALLHGKLFFDTYLNGKTDLKIVDIGAQDVNGSLRQVAPLKNEYIGVDFVSAKGVDIVISDPYELPFQSNSIDVCVSTSCFEHSDFFWLSFLEILRILKPNGLFYLNAPSNGSFHRYPVDSWRFYPDAGLSLNNWSRRNGIDSLLLESFVGHRRNDVWNDFVAIFLKNSSYLGSHPERIIDNFDTYSMGFKHGDKELRRLTSFL